MFEATFSEQLASMVGSRVEIATDTNLIEGVLVSISSELVIAVEVSTYGSGLTVFISMDAINFVRTLPAAA